MFPVSVLYKCRTLGEAGDDKLLLYGSAKDCIDTEGVLEVQPKNALRYLIWPAYFIYFIRYLIQPAYTWLRVSQPV